MIRPGSQVPLVFTDGLSNYAERGKEGVIDCHGNIIVPPRYRSVSHYSGARLY